MVTGGVVPGSVGVGSTVMVALEEAESVCTPAKASFCTSVGRSGFTRAQPPSTGADPVAVTTTSPGAVPDGTSTQTSSPLEAVVTAEPPLAASKMVNAGSVARSTGVEPDQLIVNGPTRPLSAVVVAGVIDSDGAGCDEAPTLSGPVR